MGSNAHSRHTIVGIQHTVHSDLNAYSSLPNKRTCTPYLISTKLPPCTLLFGTASLSIFWSFVKYSGLIWKNCSNQPMCMDYFRGIKQLKGLKG